MAIGKKPHLRVGAKTDTGKVRTENQDRMSRFATPIGEVFLVADGMGGHADGALAASLTVDSFEAHLRTVVPATPVPEALSAATRRANTRILEESSRSQKEGSKMGSTVVLALVSGDQATLAHVGDSRAYLFRDGWLTRLTRDHSLVQRMVDHKMLTEQEARLHPDASVLSRALGQKPDIEVEVSQPLRLKKGDGILLCSDGLCGYIEDPVIEQVLRGVMDPQEATDALVATSLSAGGEDNVTVQFLQFGERSPKVGPPPAPPPPAAAQGKGPGAQRPRSVMLWIGIALAVLVALILGALAMRFRDSSVDATAPAKNASHRRTAMSQPQGAQPGESVPPGPDSKEQKDKDQQAPVTEPKEPTAKTTLGAGSTLGVPGRQRKDEGKDQGQPGVARKVTLKIMIQNLHGTGKQEGIKDAVLKLFPESSVFFIETSSKASANLNEATVYFSAGYDEQAKRLAGELQFNCEKEPLIGTEPMGVSQLRVVVRVMPQSSRPLPSEVRP